MKKPNAQAELLSQPGELLRTSRPLLNTYLQKHTARTSELCVVHLLTHIFFYLFLDYKHKHTAVASWIYGAHALNV
jgi:hypothetical protein